MMAIETSASPTLGAGSDAALPPGGGFLLAPLASGAMLTPERLSDEHRAIRDAIGAFIEREVEPRRAGVEGKDYAAHRDLLAILGRDGFLGIDVPEAHGGSGLDKTSSVVATEAMGPSDAFAVTYAAHTGIGTLPIVFFGTEAQRGRWLPGLAAGTSVAAYALTEPSTGSDAQGIRTRATRLDDGRWRLDGTKQFITNAGFADVFTVYAKVDGEAFTAFVVPRSTPGLTVGPEERKLGIHGTSTCSLAFEGAVVDGDALLGEIGKGHRVAFNVLNVGRFKLAAAALGAMKPALATAYAYARDRQAFGRPIVAFPLVAAKLAGMAVRTYAVESVVYRVSGLIDERLGAIEGAGPDEVKAALEEYAIECSVSKVLASEELDRVVDELVQIHGGYGYIEDYPAARAYRDARINRIWEGTNEINRLLVPGTLLKRALQGRLDVLGPARRAQERLLDGSGVGAGPDGPLAEERSLVDGVRQLTLLLAGAAVQRFGTELEERQELLAGLADLSIAVLAMESSVARAEQAAADLPADRAAIHLDLARAVVRDRVGPAEIIARGLAACVAEGDDARMLQGAARRLLRSEPVDAIALGRRVASAVTTAGRYPV